MATITERLELLIDAKTGGAITAMKGVTAETKKMGDAQTQATGITGKLEGGLQKLGFSSEAAGAALKAGVVAGAAAAGYAMFKFAKDSVAATIEVTDSIRRVQQVTGAAAESASKLVAITDDYGISGEAAAKSFGKLSVNIAGGKQVFDDFGITVAKTKDGTTDFEKTLLNIADAYKNTADPAERMKLVTDAFGKSGKDLIPILEQGRKGIREMFENVPEGQIFDQDKVDAAQEYKLAMDNLGDSVNELKYGIGNALIPVLTDMANALAGVVRFATDADKALAKILPGGGSFLSGAFKGLAFGTTAFNELSGALGLAGDESDKLTDAGKRLEDAQKNLARLAAEGGKGTKEYAEAQKEYRDASEQAANVSNRVGKAIEDAGDKTERAKTKTEELAAANFLLLDSTNAVANAQLGLRGATLNVESAVESLNKVNADAEATDHDRAEAQLRVEQSLLSVSSAAAVQYSAQVKLAGGTENAYDKAQAQIAALEEQKRKFPELTPVIDAHIWELGKIPPDKTTTAHFDASAAQSRMSDYAQQLARLGGDVTTRIFADIFGGVTHGASGAVVSRPTLALIGEAGPEAVIPLNRMPGAAALPSGDLAGSGGVMMGPLTVQLVLDGQVLGQASVDYINRQASRGPGPLVTNATAAWSFPTIVVEIGFGDTPITPYFRFGVGRFDTDRFAATFVGTDISADVRAVTITRGRQRLLEACGAGTCDIILDNRDGNYDPNNLTGTYVSAGVSLVKPMLPVRVRTQYEGMWYTKFTGFADAWDQTYPGYGHDAVCVLRCTDAFKLLARHQPGQASEAAGASEATGARIGRLLDSAGWPALDRDLDTGTFTVQATTLEDNTLSEMQAVTLAEGGNLYVSTDGLVTFKERHARFEDTRSNTIQATFDDDGTDLPYSDIRTGDDDDLIKNSITGTRTDGLPQSYASGTSIGDFGIRSYNVTGLWHETDAQVATWVNYVGALFADFSSRIDSIIVKPQRSDSLWPVVLGIELGDLVLVRRHPLAGSTISKYLFVEGTRHTLTAARTWETELRFSSADGIYTAGATWFLFNDATAGKLNTGQLAPF